MPCASKPDWGQQNWIGPGLIHVVFLHHLPANATIFYRFGSVDGFRIERSFRSNMSCCFRVAHTHLYISAFLVVVSVLVVFLSRW